MLHVSLTFAPLLPSLTKDVHHRPRYEHLLEHTVIKRAEETHVDVADWYQGICTREQELAKETHVDVAS